MKIKTWRAAAARDDDGDVVDAVVGADRLGDDYSVRIVRESDWRRIMAVVNAADEMARFDPVSHPTDKPIVALSKHLAKRKRKSR